MDDDLTTCVRCHTGYALRMGDDPLTYCDRCAHEVIEQRDATIAALRAELTAARRHAVGVMAAGFNRALDRAGAPAAESPGLRVYAMRDEIARLKANAARLAEALRKHVAVMVDPEGEAALAAHDAGGKKEGGGT